MNVWNISDKKRIAIVKLVRQMMGLHIREFCKRCHISTRTYYNNLKRPVKRSCYIKILRAFMQQTHPEDILFVRNIVKHYLTHRPLEAKSQLIMRQKIQNPTN